MNLSQGSIILVPYPYTNQKAEKLRPALVISSKILNNQSPDVLATSISSQNGGSPFKIPLKQNDLAIGVIHTDSYIKYGVIFTIEKTLILKKVAKLKQEKLKEVLAKISEILTED